MVRSLLHASLLASLLASTTAAAAPARHVISMGADADATLRMLAADEHAPSLVVRHVDSERIVAEVDERQLLALSEMMHEQHDRCGGFMLHQSLDEALAPAAPERRIDYTIDRAAVVSAVLPTLSDERILQTIRELSAMKNRYYRSESGAAASAWLAAKWRTFSTRPDVTVELFDQGYPQKSVILTIPGTTRASEVVVIGGHLDSIGPGAKDANAPGADDDASGIATLTEIARALLAADVRPERTLKFMAYAAEEVGLRGSQAIVRDVKARKVDVVGALQLDMTNFQGSDRDIWIIDDYTSKAQNKFLVDLIERYTTATWGSDRCGYACSDHASWHKAGVPASMPFEARSRDMNKRIHTRHDTLEQSKDNALHAVKFARLGAAYAIELAKGTLGTAEAPSAARVDESDDRGCHRSRETPAWLWFGLALTAGGALWLARRAG